ncbi:hypothetical protein KP509_01G115800 [Ceratopteris richardii]|uniref:ABC transporter domain-containing protein n=1 Tax=Ceratopteris richardii TaxID=49495 RepID=A0A8T2VGN7_CERRI|nr:hypothetical protein KP509_01G115800 [Ceratopteris richardii]
MATSTLALCSKLCFTGLPCVPSNYSPIKVISASSPLHEGNNGVEPKIKVRNLWKKGPSGEKILEGISFNVKQGEVHGLIGPSGSGKSTVLRALNRLWEPPPSSVFLDGQDITSMDAISLRRQVGMVFQAAHLFPGTVADNVRYGPALKGQKLSIKEIENLLCIAGFTDLESPFLDKSVNELSGGEAQRVALARTLANKPKVLLLDEPTSSLDPISSRIVEDTIIQLSQSGDMTIVLVSHNLEQIGRLASNVSALDQGSLLESGPLSQVRKSNNAVLAEFFAAHPQVSS